MALIQPETVVGKTLIAKKTISLVRLPDDSAPPIFTVTTGNPVGIVEGFILPKAGRNSNLYWQFMDENNRPYYAKHEIEAFNITSLQSQGVKTLEQQQAEIEKANETIPEKIQNFLIWGGAAIAGFILLRDYLKK
jgi:hypothetical protein